MTEKQAKIERIRIIDMANKHKIITKQDKRDTS